MQVFYSDVRDYFCEWDYLQEIINYLTPKLDDEYILHVACLSEECSNYKDGVKFVEGKKNIIIGTSDEFMEDISPLYKEKADAIFKQYLLPEQESKNVFSFPLGYNKKHIVCKNKPINERTINAFFAGHMASVNRHNNLLPLIKAFENNRPDKLEIFITNGFNQGFTGLKYSEKLHNSKIAICPPGNESIETFRLYEAMRSGCVVVTPKLPVTEIYKNTSIVQVDDWNNNAATTIIDLLKDENKLTEIKKGIDKDWKEIFSPEAAAKRIIDKLNELFSNSK